MNAGNDSPEDGVDSRAAWQRLGYVTGPRIIDTWPVSQRDLAWLLLRMAAHSDSFHKPFGIWLSRGEVVTTYSLLAKRLKWKSAATVRYHLECLKATWRAVFGWSLDCSTRRTQERNFHQAEHQTKHQTEHQTEHQEYNGVS